MAKPQITLEIRMAWWLPLYKYGLATTCLLTGLEPNWQKVSDVIMSAIRIRVRTCRD